MKRPFPRFEVLGLTAALVGVACTPSNSVKPGAPVLMEMTIVENGGASYTTVKADTPSCPPGTADQGGCASAISACQAITTNILCRCIANPPPPPPPPPSDAGAPDAGMSDGGAIDAAMSDAAVPDAGASAPDAASPFDGTWSCSFSPTSQVLYVFDRLLYTPPFEADPDNGVAGVATPVFTPANAAASVLAKYASDGVQNGTIFPMLGFPNGPSIWVTGAPALPTSSTVSVTLEKTKVLAKDGRTPFVGALLDASAGPLIDGAITFVTQAFTASVAGPPAPMGPADAAPLDPAPDNTPATITFNNIVDPTALVAHVTVTPVTVSVELASVDGLNVTLTPKKGTTWPASTTITIAVDATTADVVGDTLGAAASASFTTSAKQ
jgi:hypothetical protein